tara:strand:+ start:198 stop:998 length:801 start_codon:yes stop_codon:yes gene_type:complete
MKKKIIKPIEQPSYLKPTSSLFLSQTFWRLLRKIIGKNLWTFFYKLSQKVKIKKKLFQLTNENMDLKNNLNYPNPLKNNVEIKKFSFYLDRHKSSRSIGNYRDYLDNKFNLIRDNVTTILEIGISYGAGILALKDYFNNSFLWGVDIDRSTFLQEQRIVKCEWVDQLKIDTLKEAAVKFNVKFDLIIDDGWHHPEAQINSLIAYLPYLNYKGTYIVEDIVHKDYYNHFQKVKTILEKKDFMVEYEKFTPLDRVDITGCLLIQRKAQ